MLFPHTFPFTACMLRAVPLFPTIRLPLLFSSEKNIKYDYVKHKHNKTDN